MTASANPSLVQRVIDAYGLDCQVIHEPQSGYRNTVYPLQLSSHQMVNLTFYKREPGILAKIRAANYISDHLAASGLPARQTHDSRILSLHSTARTAYAALYNYLPGETILWEAYTQEHIKLLGSMMAQMHHVLGRFNTASTPPSPVLLPNVYEQYRDILDRMQKYYANNLVQIALQSKLGIRVNLRKLARFGPLLDVAATLPQPQPLHMDFVRGNVLFKLDPASRRPILTGILDFEKTALGHPIVDAARTLAFLLVDCPKPEGKVRKYFIASGYTKRGGMRLRHRNLLDPLVGLFLSYDFYKFLQHNPYDHLDQNHHFIGTRNLLLARGLLE